MEDMYQTLKPLYENLHAYVRRQLKKEYGDKVFPKSGHIPANILGKWDYLKIQRDLFMIFTKMIHNIKTTQTMMNTIFIVICMVL